MPFVFSGQRNLHRLPLRKTKPFHVELPRCHMIASAKGAGEVRARRETAGESDISKSRPVPVRQKEDGTFKPDPFNERCQCFPHQGSKNPVEMIRRKTRDPGDLLASQLLPQGA